jgi:8-oxo-dGTP pyrophosphatase MutT (NUDIX family)
MGFEPQKLYIGVVDLFAVFLPGALITFLLADSVGPELLGNSRYQHMQGAERWLVFGFASYLAGHFIFLLSAFVLDDHVYDRVRRATPVGERRHLASGGRPSSRLARWLARVSAAGTADEAVRQAELLREMDLGRLGATRSINTFQWSKARLTLDHPEASVSVQRFEADSKFFRSLVVVLPIAGIWGAAAGHIALAIWSVPLTMAAFVRYVDQRVKATRQAYWFIITIAADESAAGSRPDVPPKADGSACTHAGGVVYRGARNGQKGAIVRQFLLVYASNSRDERVLPKGHVEPGERTTEAAVREVAEEAGVLARIVRELDVVELASPAGPTRVAFYLMDVVGHRDQPEDGRDPIWLPSDKAIDSATYAETKRLIERAVVLLNTTSDERPTPDRRR